MRRRKPKVVWLPPTNAFSVDPLNTSAWQIASLTFDGTAVGNIGAIEVPIVLDGTQSDPLDATSSLADIESSGYRLRRICGKIFIFLAVPDVQDVVTGMFGVSAGFIIRRTNVSTGGSLAVAADPTFESIDPAAIRNSSDPWIWRRDWLLNDGANEQGAAVALTNQAAQRIANQLKAPGTNTSKAGYLHESAHVDQKTARIVGPEERLFLDVTATSIFAAAEQTTMVLIYQFRVLASMRSNIGNRRNASR